MILWCNVELMLMGLISLLLARLQDVIVRLCIPESWAHVGLPCKHKKDTAADSNTTSMTHFSIATGRHLLAEESPLSHCPQVYVTSIQSLRCQKCFSCIFSQHFCWVRNLSMWWCA